jgi:hypothetical protein
MMWQKLQDVLPLIGVIAVVLLPSPAALDKETATVMMSAVELLHVVPITV